MDYQETILNCYLKKNFLKCLTLIEDCPVQKAKESNQYKLLKASCFLELGIQLQMSSEIVEIVDEVLKENEMNEFAIYIKGLLYLKTKDIKNAIISFDKAIEINPEAMGRAKELRKRAENHENLDEEISISEQQQTSNEDNRCSLCNKTFASRANLNRHILLHSSDKPNRCEFCKLGFAERSDLVAHVAQTHLIVKFCEKTFKTEDDHQETCAEEQKNDVKKCEDEDFPVAICVEKTSTNSPEPLSSEVLAPIDERPFKCSECSKSFKLQKLLSYHENLHKKSSFECDYCGKKMNDQGALFSHMNIHKDLKGFRCNLCNFHFSSISLLGSHFRSFHGVGNKKQ